MALHQPTGSRRYAPDPRILHLIDRHGAARVGRALALDADALRRYAAGVSRRTTRWWIEAHAGVIQSDLEHGDRA